MGVEDIHEEFDDEIEAGQPSEEEVQLVAEDRAAGDDIHEGAQASEKEEPAEEQAATEEPVEEKPESTVPYGALHSEREMRKEVQQQLLDTQRQLGELMHLKDEFAKLRDGQKETQDDEDMEREFEEDPIGALRKQQEAIQQKLETSDKTQEEQRQNQEAFQNMVREVTSKVADFEKDNPDYQQAFKYLHEARVKEYVAMGITDKAQQQQAFDQESLAIAQGAMQRGENPAEIVYGIAKARGYVKGNEAAPADGESLEKTMQRIDKGIRDSETNATAGGGAPESGPSLTDISSMSDSEFDEYWAQMEKAAYGSSR